MKAVRLEVNLDVAKSDITNDDVRSHVDWLLRTRLNKYIVLQSVLVTKESK